jgi:hypothetical protein
MYSAKIRQSLLISGRGTLLRWTAILAVLGVVALMGVVVPTAAPASAEIKFCSQTVCIGSANGCSTPTTTGVVIQADNGDSFIATDGTRWTCKNGKWEKSTPKAAIGTRGPVLGIGLFFRGSKPEDPCDLSPEFDVIVVDCQSIILLTSTQ